MSYDQELFKGKNLSNLFEEIYNNSVKKRDDIDAIIAETTSLIESTEDVIQVAPLIKDYLEVSVKNNEHLIKLAGIAQSISNSSGVDSLESVLDFDNLQSLLDESRQELKAPSKSTDDEDTD
jgi:hypothetical protein